MSDKMLIIILIALGLFFCSVFWIVTFIQTTKQKRRAKKERWGEFIEPESGISWDLGRVVVNWGVRNDSLPYLESWGFKFLGYVDEVMLRVEPPKDWKKIPNGRCLSLGKRSSGHLHSWCTVWQKNVGQVDGRKRWDPSSFPRQHSGYRAHRWKSALTLGIKPQSPDLIIRSGDFILSYLVCSGTSQVSAYLGSTPFTAYSLTLSFFTIAIIFSTNLLGSSS